MYCAVALLQISGWRESKIQRPLDRSYNICVFCVTTQITNASDAGWTADGWEDTELLRDEICSTACLCHVTRRQTYRCRSWPSNSSTVRLHAGTSQTTSSSVVRGDGIRQRDGSVGPARASTTDWRRRKHVVGCDPHWPVRPLPGTLATTILSWSLSLRKRWTAGWRSGWRAKTLAGFSRRQAARHRQTFLLQCDQGLSVSQEVGEGWCASVSRAVQGPDTPSCRRFGATTTARLLSTAQSSFLWADRHGLRLELNPFWSRWRRIIHHVTVRHKVVSLLPLAMRQY